MHRQTRSHPRIPPASTLLIALVAVGCSSSPTGELRQKQAALNVPITFKFDNFNNVSLLQLNGHAVQSSPSLRLTSNLASQAGSVFTRQKVSLRNDRSFSTYFSMRMTSAGSSPGFTAGADGIVFVIQPVSSTAGSSSGLGYQGIPQSLGVEFDSAHDAAQGDPDNYHVGTHLNGDMSSHLQLATAESIWFGGTTWNVWIDYDGVSNRLEVRADDNGNVRPVSPLLVQNGLELSSIFGADEVYAGFTAATAGGAWERHWIDAWYFQNDYAPLDPASNTYTQAPTQVAVTASPATLTRSATITATVSNFDGTVSPGTAVTLAASVGSISPTTATTDANGQVQATLTYSGATDVTGRVTVTATSGAYGTADVGLAGNRTITASAGSGGTISPSGAVDVPYGGSQTFSITPATGYHRVSVVVDGVSLGAVPSFTFNNVTGPRTISATFAIDTFTITAAPGPHGSISPAGSQTVNYGSTPIYSITPDAAYKVADVRVDDVSVGAVTSYSFPAVTGNRTISATFTIIDTPPELNVSSGTTTWTEEAPPAIVDPGLTLTDPDGPDIAGVTVAISGGYVPTQDRLAVVPADGFTSTFDASTGVLTITGSSSASGWQDLLRRVTYSNVAAGTPDTRARQVTFTLKMGDATYSAENGHYYELVRGGAITWTGARTAAAARTYFGWQGYLATITSAAENDFLGRLEWENPAWVGASDQAQEWTWRWVTGPEGLEAGGLGRHFSTQYASTCSVGPVGGQYQHWGPCEPFDTSSAYDHVVWYQGGWYSWLDSADFQSYFVEYGGMPGDPALKLAGTKDLQVLPLPAFTITAGAGPNGSISPSGSQSVKQGHSITFQLLPAEHFHVLDVTVDGESKGPSTTYTFSAVTANATIVASFDIDLMAVNTSADGLGTIECDSPVPWGTQSTCTIQAKESWELAKLIDGEEDALGRVEGERFVTSSVTGPRTVRATFLKSRGVACGAEGECQSGFCVDGVCCESACSEQCQSCGGERPGYCAPVTGTPRGGRPSCDSDGSLCGGACDGVKADACTFPGEEAQCRSGSCSAGTATLPASCDGAGACPGPKTVSCGAYSCGPTACNGDCESDADCAGDHWCSGGICQPRSPAGQACDGDNQCASGFCADGFCCGVACDGQCEACGEPGQEGQCVPVAGRPRGARPLCANDGSGCGGTCDGVSTNVCRYPGSSVQCRTASCAGGVATLAAVCNGQGACPTEQRQECDGYVCGEQACLGDCDSDKDCASGFWCSAGVCEPKKANAVACSADDQCGSGFCVDGVCCDAACEGQCQACDVSGHVGQCAPATGAPHGARPACGSDGSECGGACDGTDVTACTYPDETEICRPPGCAGGVATVGAVCDGHGGCPAEQKQECGRYTCGGTSCRGDCQFDGDCAPGHWCSAGVCIAQNEQGQLCGLDNQCATGQCVDGVCCSAACDGQCEACDVPGHEGQCVAVSGSPRGTRPACNGDGSSCGGTCDGAWTKACAYPGTAVSCRAASCSAGTAIAGAACDGNGHCPERISSACERYTCGDTACKTSCQADADCGAGLRCVEGACWTDRELEDARLAKLGGFIAKGDGFGCSAVPSDASVLYLALTVAAVLLWRYRGAPARIRKR